MTITISTCLRKCMIGLGWYRCGRMFLKSSMAVRAECGIIIRVSRQDQGAACVTAAFILRTAYSYPDATWENESWN